MAFRFVHAADIHLDSPLRSLALRDPELAELVGDATRRALTSIVDLCLDEQVDALLLAGDLYDGEQTSMKTARFLAGEMRRLHEAGVRVFIIRGNHDALSRITRELTLPETVKVFGGRAETVTIDAAAGRFPVAIHGLSFAQAHAPESLLGKYRAPVEGAVNIGLMHTSLGGAAGHDLYAPCSVADLVSSGFRYWALGHIHMCSVVEGDCTIVMPGIPQGRHVNEAGAKSVTLVTVADDGAIRHEQRATSIAEFARVAVQADGVEDWRDLVGRIEKALARARQDAGSPNLVARLSIEGRSPLAWRMRRDGDLLKADADMVAARLGAVFVEKIDIAADPVRAAVVAGADPLTELDRLINDEVLADAAYAQALETVVDELRAQLPPECRDLFGDSEETLAAALRELAGEGARDVVARLRPVSDEGTRD